MFTTLPKLELELARRKPFVQFLSFALFCATSFSTAIAAPATYFAPAKDVQFANYKSVVTHYLKKRHARAKTEVCVLGQNLDNAEKQAWVIWPQGEEIILFENGETDLRFARRKLNLKKDVVSDDAQVNGSTYLVTHAWVQQLQKNCQQYGNTFQFKK